MTKRRKAPPSPWCEPCRSFHPATTPHVSDMPVQAWIPAALIEAARKAADEAAQSPSTEARERFGTKCIDIAAYVLRQVKP